MEQRKLERNAPHQKYITAEGLEVPGGSTICKIGDDPCALIHWAWALGKDGKDYRAERDKAADIGTLAHFMCEAFLNGFVCDLSDYDQADIDKALVCYNKFVDWWEAEGLSKIATEAQMVHPTKRFGGTIDLVAFDRENKVCLIDIKTSKRISDSYIRQIAGYTELWDFCQVEEKTKVNRWAIVRIGKQEEGDFEVVWYDADRIKNAQNTFFQQVELYWAIKDEKASIPKKPRGKKKKD
jgi:hypothetical protein